MSELKDKINEMLKNKEQLDEFTMLTADIMPVITELAQVDWASGKRKMQIACKKLLQIAESNEPVAKAFMRALNKAVKQVAEMTESKVKKGVFANKDKKVI